MHIPTQKKVSLASVFFTFFVDNLCWSIVFPIFAPYFLNKNNPLFSSGASLETKTTALGLFLMAFSLGQFLGAPILGEFSDKHGRRKTLLLTIPCMLIGLCLTAVSMRHYELFGLFAGRLITGIFASNGSICLAAVSDLSENEKDKGKNFGYFSAMAGLSFVVGAFAGGKLSDATINAAFTPELPIWLATALTAMNVVFVFFGFKETMHPHLSTKFSLFSCFQNIKIALSKRELHNIYIIYFLFIFAWNILLQFISVIMIQRFSFTESNIGDLALYVGIFWAIGSGYLKQFLTKHFSSNRLMKVCFVMLFLLTAFVILPREIYSILVILGLCTLIGGATWPLCTSLISNLAPKEMQGKILSMSQSVQSFAMAIGPVVAGLSFKFSSLAPFWIAAVLFLFGAIVPVKSKGVSNAS